MAASAGTQAAACPPFDAVYPAGRLGIYAAQIEMQRSSLLWRSWRVAADAARHFNNDDGWAMASHVALSALMAVFPFLIFVAALAAVIGDAGLADRVTDEIFAAWPEQVAAPIAREIHQVLAVPRGGLLTISVAVTIVLASNGVEAVRVALNRAYDVQETRGFLWLRGQSILFVLVGAVASLIVAVLGILGPAIFDRIAAHFPDLRQFAKLFAYASVGVTGLTLVAALLAAHLWLPARRYPLSRLWPGVLLTLATWLAGAFGFGVYLRSFGNYILTYAGLASVVTAIFFLYLVAMLMIFGAELNASLARAHGAHEVAEATPASG
jgi:membrane protein